MVYRGMKKILFFLLIVSLGIVVAIIVVRSKTNTILTERLVDEVPAIEISGVLDAAGARKIVKLLKQAEATRPAFIVLSFDSPGGELAGTFDVADAISSLSIPTVAFVREGIAGTVFMIAATNQIYFAPDGICGAAAPIIVTANSEIDEMSRKIRILAQTKVQGYAESNGHDPAVFGAMMDPGIELTRDGNAWKTRGTLLSLTAQEAAMIGLSIGTAASVEEVVSKHKLLISEKVEIEPPPASP